MLGTAQPPSRSFPSDRDGPTPVGYLRLMSLHVEARCSLPRWDAPRAPGREQRLFRPLPSNILFRDVASALIIFIFSFFFLLIYSYSSYIFLAFPTKCAETELLQHLKSFSQTPACVAQRV